MWAFHTLLIVTLVIFCFIENLQTSEVTNNSVKDLLAPAEKSELINLCKNDKIQKFITKRYLKCLSNKTRLAHLLVKINNVYCDNINPFTGKEKWEKYESRYEFLPKSPRNKTTRDWFNDLNIYFQSFKFLHHKYTSDGQCIEKFEVYKEKAKTVVYASENLLTHLKQSMRQSNSVKKVEDLYIYHQSKNNRFLNQKFTMFFFWKYLQHLRYAIADKLKNVYC